MDDKKKNLILNLNDTDFISYLYSERERENSLSQVPGWSNWALFGAIAAVLWTAYGIAKEATINYDCLLYYMSGLIALFWNYRSWDKFFKRERGVDYNRVKLLKQIFPKVDFGMIYACSLFFVVALFNEHGMDIIAWFWMIVAFWYSFAFVSSFVQRNMVVSSWLNNSFFKSFWLSLVFELFASLLFCFICPLSFKKASSTIYCAEFELGLCLDVIIILVYIFLKTNIGNSAVKKFDVIIDDYLYKGVSKEITYQKILINRMGYGVIEVCEKEIKTIKEILKDYDEEYESIKTINTAIKADGISQKEIDDFIPKLKASIYYQDKLINGSKRLIERVKQITECAPELTDIDSLNSIVETNEMIIEKIDKISLITSDTITIIEERIKPYRCHKYGGLCHNMECEMRNDKMSLWNRIQRRFYFINKKKHPINDSIFDS